jgi:putative transposase
VIREVCRKHNITEQTFFRWRNKYGEMTVSDARKLKELESENARLKKIVAEQMLAIEGLKEIAAKNVWSAPHLQGPLLATRTVCLTQQSRI